MAVSLRRRFADLHGESRLHRHHRVEILASGTEILVVTANLAIMPMSRKGAVFTSVTEPNGTVLPTVIAFDARRQ
jgi:hypothetical protein